MTTGLNDRIRDFVNRQFIEPARAEGMAQITINSGEVHADLDLKNRMPAVCSAIDAKKFAERYRVVVSSRSGPNQGATVTWVLGILP